MRLVALSIVSSVWTVGMLSAQPATERVAAVAVAGTVFLDKNGNGVRDQDEPGIANAIVSDQIGVVTTDADGHFAMTASGYGLLFVEPPDGYAARGPFWRKAAAGAELAFPLVTVPNPRSFTFVHASDTHLGPESLPRTRRLEALVDSLKPAFVLITGDLVRDALRVSEPEAAGYFDLLGRELGAFKVPVFLVPGNHDIFGIERHRSLVSPTNPLYGKRFYRSRFGPNYYAFNWGGIHFVGLDTVDYFDLEYYAHVDSAQVRWLGEDLARLPAGTPVVTFNHIPLVSGAQTIDGYDDESVAPTIIRLSGKYQFRHTVQNNSEVVDLIGPRLEIALGGHFHIREFLRYETRTGTHRFAQTAAVVGPPAGSGPLGIRSGITLYHVTDRKVDDGTFIALDP